MSVRVRHLISELSLSQPCLLCGTMDSSLIAKHVIDYLIEKLNAKLFREIYSNYFPSYVLVKNDGTVELMKNELYFWRNNTQKNDLVLFTGNTQPLTPEGQYEVAYEVLNLAEELNVKKVFTFSAYLVKGYSDNGKPKVYAVATEKETLNELKKYNIKILDKGYVRGLNGLIFGLAKLKKIEGICLFAETVSYLTPSGRMVVDVKPVQTILETLTKILDVKIDLAEIEKQVKLTEDFIRKLEEIERQALEELSRTFDLKKQTYYI
ncbi:MAG: PAC2 family protein [Candidatus Bathyarchaeota archaeon]